MTRLVSWNVNGIRACIKNGFHTFMEQDKPDIICLQEIKAFPEQVGLNLPDYEQYWNPAQKPGYSGTAIFTRLKPLQVRYGIGVENLDTEGRVTTAEFADYFVVTVYTPNSQRGLARLDFRTQQWDVAFRQYVAGLQEQKPVIFCGDLNVAHKEIDLANPKQNVQNAGFTPQERASFDALLQSGFSDTFRLFHPEPGHYSWWTYRLDARQRNIGWRLDYFCVSERLKSRVKAAAIHADILGSDHCPVSLNIGAP